MRMLSAAAVVVLLTAPAYAQAPNINLMPEFQSKNPGISVDVQFVPEAQIQQKLLAAKAANNAPDVTAIDETFEDTLWKNKLDFGPFGEGRMGRLPWRGV